MRIRSKCTQGKKNCKSLLPNQEITTVKLYVEKIGLCPFQKNNPGFCPLSQTN